MCVCVCGGCGGGGGVGVSGVGMGEPLSIFFHPSLQGIFLQQVYTKNTSVLNFYTAGIKKNNRSFFR